MNRWDLEPSLRRILLYYMTSYLSVSSETPLTNLADEYLMLLETHQTIGVCSLLFGFFSTGEWVRLQDQYLRAVGLPQQKHEALRAIALLLPPSTINVMSFGCCVNNTYMGLIQITPPHINTSTFLRRSVNCTRQHPT
jgi:hypothetical protein